MIYQFREIVQSDDEQFFTFVNRLREVAKHCEFPDMERKSKKTDNSEDLQQVNQAKSLTFGKRTYLL